MKKNVLDIKNLTKYYGKVLAVDNLSISLKQGEVFAFIGPNGAGKSSTIRCIMNLINKTSGTIFMDGQILDKQNTFLKEKIGYLPSEIYLYEDFTVKQMLDYHESFYRKDINKRRVELVNKLKVDESKKIENLSLGNLKKVGIILSLMHEPKLLILDEPTSGLDPIMQQIFFDLIEEEKNKGTTIFYSTHVLSEVAKVCDRVGIIKEGRLLAVETPKELLNKHLTNVTIESKQIDKIIDNIKIEVLTREKNLITFKNNLPSDKLIKLLSKYQIDKILIEPSSIEDILLHYYK